jgi:hypothetical protein
LLNFLIILSRNGFLRVPGKKTNMKRRTHKNMYAFINENRGKVEKKEETSET